MAPRLPLHAVFTAQPLFRASRRLPARIASYSSASRTSTRFNPPRKTPKDVWTLLAKQLSMEHVTLRGIDAACKARKSQGIFTRSTAVDYHDCALAFFTSVQAGSSPGATYLLDQPKFDAATIYETGCILHSQHSSLGPFALCMWASASGMGFVPATIMVVEDLVKNRKFGMIPAMQKHESEFRRIVQEGKDANALATEGLRFLRQERDVSKAAAIFKKALSVGGDDFSYKSRCDHGLGYIAYKEGRLEEAAEHLEKAYQFDPVNSGVLLGDIYASSDVQKARQVYYRTGSYGKTSAWGRLADLELGMAMDVQDESTRQEHRLWAMEFQRLKDQQEAALVEND